MYFLFGENEPSEKHTQEQKNFQTFHSRVSTWHSPRNEKKNCSRPYKIKTGNQNMNKTYMKHVQQRHFLCKRASRVAEMFPKTCVFFVFVKGLFTRRWGTPDRWGNTVAGHPTYHVNVQKA